jgi:two-component system chemotaxis sensor kinase CheA
MSAGVDLSQFFDTFFDEADELLAEMEQQLIELDVATPDADSLNGIFRAAHSIKGGAGTFGCFDHLAQTTHLLENVLDSLRRGEMPLRKDMIDLFLDTKDVLTDQIAAYRKGEDPDALAYERICAQLLELAREHAAAAGIAGTPAAVAAAAGDAAAAPPAGGAPAAARGTDVAAPAPAHESAGGPAAAQEAAGGVEVFTVRVDLRGRDPKDAEALNTEMSILGEVLRSSFADGVLSLLLRTSCSAGDVEAVCCFVVDAGQVEVGAADAAADLAPEPPAAPAPAASVAAAPAPAAAVMQPAAAAAPAPAADDARRKAAPAAAAKGGKEAGTIRVGVEKVDQIINLVGELVITQAMLVQTASTLDPVVHDRLLNGIEQLERNARDLQEAVMSIRMMPMDYVFSRFPRMVRESAARLGKQISLQTYGQATELDKSLIERIIDPLTHLVRNSLDHGIETPERRVAAGKDPEGQLTLSAQHNGGQIVIEVSDDGGGLNRERILAKAAQQGIAISDTAGDDEVWQLIFAPGFSTAEQVTDISGRGVGMDVVRRNIQGMGGHIQLSSRPGQGTTTRIMLPLTLAILDGMSVRVGEETFILPLSHVTESMQPSPDQIRSLSEDEQVLHVRGEYLPMIALHKVFDVQGAQTEASRSIAVILQAEEVRFALLVDHLIGQHQVVVKNLESNYRKIPGVSAATILGDGSVALIVDVFALLRMTRERALC